jgi:peptidoglycan/xylan/chitin deacetylase (PgdA/CDA1 family)
VFFFAKFFYAYYHKFEKFFVYISKKNNKRKTTKLSKYLQNQPFFKLSHFVSLRIVKERFDAVHFFVVKSKHIKFIIMVILAALLLSISIDGVASAQVFFGQPVKRVPIYCVATQEKKVAISFDAAWGADKTEAIMSTCKEYGANATFFLVGFWVDKYGDMVRKIDQNGFEIGTHSKTHPDMTKLSKEAVREELEGSVKLIEQITNKPVKYFRPPYGAYNNQLLDMAEDLSLVTIQWDVDSLDWKGLSAQAIAQRVLGAVKNGSIILMHNNADNVVPALVLILTRLNQLGYKVTTVGDLVYQQNYIIDKNGVQRAK